MSAFFSQKKSETAFLVYYITPTYHQQVEKLEIPYLSHMNVLYYRKNELFTELLKTQTLIFFTSNTVVK